MTSPITLAQAAMLAELWTGQRRTPDSLRHAAQRGALKADRIHDRLWLTTERDLRAYLDGRPERFKARTAA